MQLRWHRELPDRLAIIDWFIFAQYSDSGWFTCQGLPGSFMHEERDALTFQAWGFDFLKWVSSFLYHVRNIDDSSVQV